MVNIATVAASCGTSQFTKYFEDMREVEKLGRANSDLKIRRSEMQEMSQESREEPLLEPCDEEVVLGSEVAGKCLQFGRKVKARGRPKRSQRQLCSFNRSSADKEVSGKSRRGRKRPAVVPVSGPKKRQCRSSHQCPVCVPAIEECERGVISTECCFLRIHSQCFREVEECPDCGAP